MNSRIFLGVFALITASCANNAPTSSAELVEQAREETSWHCEESAGSWSCKRRTIGEIQQRQAASEARKFDWSRSETETLTRVNESSAEPAEIAANEFAEARPTRQMPTEPQTANPVTRPAQTARQSPTRRREWPHRNRRPISNSCTDRMRPCPWRTFQAVIGPYSL